MAQETLPRLPKLPKDLPRLPKLPRLGDVNTYQPVEVDTPFVPRVTQPDTPEDVKRQTDNFGWIKNMPKSLFDLTKSVAYDLPKAVIESGIKYGQNPEQYTKDLALVFAKNNGLGTMFREQLVDYYTNDFWHNFNEDPAHFLSDVATLASLGGGAVAKAGKLGGMAKVAQAGAKIGKFGNAIDPMMAVGKLAGKAAEPIMESLGFGKYTKQLNALRAQIAAEQAIDMNNEVARVIFGKMTPEENAKLLRLIRWGERTEQAAAEVGSDLVSKRFKIWREAITGGDEPLFKELHLLDDDAAKSANATKMAEYSQTHFKELGLQGPITPKQAAEMMVSGTHNPTFMSSFRLKSQAQDLFEAVNKASYRGGFWSRFEKANGNRKLIEDVDTIMARQIVSKHDALLKLKTARAVEAFMQEVGELKFAAKGIHFDAPKGHAILQGPFWEKYWGDMGHSGQAGADAMVRAMNSGADGQGILAAAKEAIESNPNINRWAAAKGDTYVPKHVAAWLNREMAPISPIGRLYDKALGTFKGLATVMNPRFWGSVIFGNTILGLLYGISPDYARIAYKYRDFLPPELRAVTRAEYFLAQKGIYSRVSNSLGDFAQKLDNLFRLPMFAQELSKDSYVRMKMAGNAFFLSKDQIINAVKHYGQAPERLMKTRMTIDQLKRQLTGTMRELQDLERAERIAATGLAHAAAREGPRKSAPGYDELGNKKVSAPVDIENIKKAKAVGGKPGPDVGVEYNELGQVVKGPTKMQDPTFGELNTLDKRVGPVPGVTLPDDLMEYVQGLRSAGMGDQDIARFLQSRTVQAELRKLKQPHATPELRSAGDEAKQIKVNELTGLPEPEFGPSGQGGEPQYLPVDTMMDPATGNPIIRDAEGHFWEFSDGGKMKPLSQLQEKMIELSRKQGNLEDVIKSKREDAIRKLAEVGELQRKLPELAADAAVADRAIDVGNRFYGSYLRLSPFERKTLRRILPFYTFNKAMTMLAFRFPFLYPKRAFIGAHLAQAWYDLMSDENSYLPARLRDYVPVMAREDGSVVAISSGYMNPLSSAKVGDFAQMPLPSVFNPLKSHPVISLVLKMNGSIPEWSGKPLSVGDTATRLDNGQVVKWTGKGFKTEIAQPSLFKSLFDLFPQSQLINRLVHPYAQSDRGWLFSPDPLVGPDGKVRYPRELIELTLSNVIPTQVYNPAEIRVQEEARMRAIAKSYMDDLRFASPVRRAQILEILKAWQNEKNRRWVQ